MPFSAPLLLRWVFVEVTASRELLLTDAFAWLNIDDAGAISVTVPDPADVDFEQGTQIAFEQVGAGVLTLVPGSNVTLNSNGALLDSNGQFSVVSITLKTTGAASVWTVFGDRV